MKKKIVNLVIIAALTLPGGVLAMKDIEQDQSKGEKMDHGSMSAEHDKAEDAAPSGMDMGGELIVLKDQEVDNIKGSAYLMDVKEMMADLGMPMTHHMMVGFSDLQGEKVREGRVAVKVKAPDGEIAAPIKMMPMSGEFGADITLDQKGTYQFLIGTKLADGKKRTFQFDYEN